MEYRDVALEAVITLGVIVDSMHGDSLERLGARAEMLAAKLAIADGGDDAGRVLSDLSDALAEYESELRGDAEGDDDEPEDSVAGEPDELGEPEGESIQGDRAEGPEAANVTVIPAIERKPLPNEHPLALKGSGRGGKPQRRFRMRRIGESKWAEGSASEVARHFGVTPSQVYKWAGGKAESKSYEVEAI